MKKHQETPIKKHPFITDHALVQWLRRVHGIDVDRLKDMMLTPRQIEMLEKNATRIKTTECTFILQKKRVVTVLADGGANDLGS